MKKGVVSYIIILIFATFYSFPSQAALPVDTILYRAMNAAEKYNDLVEHFTAEVYTRTYLETVKKNFFYKYTHLIPRFAVHDPKNDEALIRPLVNFDANIAQLCADIRYIGNAYRKKDIEMIPFGCEH